MVVGALIVIGVLVLGVVLALLMRRATLDEAGTETRLHRPETHTLAYAVPDGQDAAMFMAALTHEGFTSVADHEGGTERLLIACSEQDRAKVRGIIEHVRLTGFGYTGPARHLDHVSFQDEA